MKKTPAKKTTTKKKVTVSKVINKSESKQQGPSTFLLGALIFSILLLIAVLLWRHQMLDDVEDLNSTGFRGAVRQQKDFIKEQVKTEIREKVSN